MYQNIIQMQNSMRLSGNRLFLGQKPMKAPSNQPLPQRISSPPQSLKRLEDYSRNDKQTFRRKSQAPKSIISNKFLKQSYSLSKPFTETRQMTNIEQKGVKISKRDSMMSNPPQFSKTVKASDIKMKGNQIVSQEWAMMEAYYRYAPMTVITMCGLRAELNLHFEQTGVKVFNGPPKKDQPEAYDKLLKHCKLKGKYKYRERHNPSNSQQLKSIGYKFIRKESKKTKKQSDSDEQSEEEKGKQKCRNLATWKKSMGTDSKVFILKGGYVALKYALLERGWIQNPDKYSKLFDFKWTTKINDIEFASLQPQQLVNHFNMNHSLTSKFGLCKTLRCLAGNDLIDMDKFFPRCFDLADLADFENFVQDYKYTYCQSIVKKYLKDKTPLEHKVYIALQVLERKVTPLLIKLGHLNSRAFAICSPQEWAVISNQQTRQDIIKKTIAKPERFQPLQQKSKQMLVKLKAHNPQFDLNGSKNIWILKPNYLSRGRGIKCFSKIYDILDLVFNKDMQYVAQKYIQNPLLIKGKKFDIRQWILVQDYSPPKIWMFDQFYLRLCAEQYDMSNLSNKYVHLTNNSIQKYSKQFHKSQIQGNMMFQSDFSQLLGVKDGRPLLDDIRKKMKDIIINSIRVTEDQVSGRKNSFQLFGYDFMIDDNLNPWLIEVNSSPSMDTSTPVTKKLVKLVLEDCVKVLVDQKKKKKSDTGLFRCIYKAGDTIKSPYNIDYQ